MNVVTFNGVLANAAIWAFTMSVAGLIWINEAIYYCLQCFFRMFSATTDYSKANEKGEFVVAQGISSTVFKSILVRKPSCLTWA